MVLAIDAKRAGESWEAYLAGGRTPDRPRRGGLGTRGHRARGGGDPAHEHGPRRHDRGYDLDLTATVAGAVTVPVIASGGAGRLEHLSQAIQAGADAVLCASILHYERHTVAEIKTQLARDGRRGPPAGHLMNFAEPAWMAACARRWGDSR